MVSPQKRGRIERTNLERELHLIGAFSKENSSKKAGKSQTKNVNIFYLLNTVKNICVIIVISVVAYDFVAKKKKGHKIAYIRNCQYQDKMDKFKARDKPLKLIQSYIHTCIQALIHT